MSNMGELTVEIPDDKEWRPVLEVRGVPDCIACGIPLLIVSALYNIYGFCVQCRTYYTVQDKEQA